jgi:hypothetical protein
MFKTLVGKVNKHQIGKFVKHRYLKCPRIVHLDLIFISYEQKKRQLEFDF